MMRVYQPEELAELVVGLDDYEWDIGRIKLNVGPIHATYLIGTAKKS